MSWWWAISRPRGATPSPSCCSSPSCSSVPPASSEATRPRKSDVKRLVTVAATLAALVVVQLAVPRVVNPYVLQIIVLCGINIVLAVSLNLINGFTGQFSIGHAGFMAIGAYASAMFSLHVGKGWVQALSGAGVPLGIAQGAALLVGLLLGGLLAAIAGYFVGLPSLRLRGDYLAIVTLGFGEIIRVLIIN